MDTVQDGKLLRYMHSPCMGPISFRMGILLKMAEAAEYLQSSRYVTKIMASGNWRIMKNHWTAASMAIQSVPCSQKSFGSDVSLYGKRDLKELKRQEQSYAMAYLKTIEREAEIGDYSDFPHTIPSEVGISTEVSNKIDEARKYGKGPLAYAPFWFGTVEQVENGVRYLYEQRYDAEQKGNFVFQNSI